MGTSEQVLQLDIKYIKHNDSISLITHIRQLFTIVWENELSCRYCAGIIRVECAQGYGIGRYDIVFGTNVVHTIRSVGRALQQCKALLRKGGLLALNELSTKMPFWFLTFGLTDAWRLYDDESRRITGGPGSAASSASSMSLL